MGLCQAARLFELCLEDFNVQKRWFVDEGAAGLDREHPIHGGDENSRIALVAREEVCGLRAVGV